MKGSSTPRSVSTRRRRSRCRSGSLSLACISRLALGPGRGPEDQRHHVRGARTDSQLYRVGEIGRRVDIPAYRLDRRQARPGPRRTPGGPRRNPPRSADPARPRRRGEHRRTGAGQVDHEAAAPVQAARTASARRAAVRADPPTARRLRSRELGGSDGGAVHQCFVEPCGREVRYNARADRCDVRGTTGSSVTTRTARTRGELQCCRSSVDCEGTGELRTVLG